MTAAVGLQDAAGLAYTNVATLQAAGILDTKLTLFWQDLNIPGLFEEQTPNDHPIGNWIALIAALTEGMTTPASITDVNAAAQYVYRLCLLARALDPSHLNLLSATQVAAILTAYNDNLA